MSPSLDSRASTSLRKKLLTRSVIKLSRSSKTNRQGDDCLALMKISRMAYSGPWLQHIRVSSIQGLGGKVATPSSQGFDVKCRNGIQASIKRVHQSLDGYSLPVPWQLLKMVPCILFLCECITWTLRGPIYIRSFVLVGYIRSPSS